MHGEHEIGVQKCSALTLEVFNESNLVFDASHTPGSGIRIGYDEHVCKATASRTGPRSDNMSKRWHRGVAVELLSEQAKLEP